MTDTASQIKAASLGKTHLFFLGQAGYVIKSPEGKLLGIDLYLSDCVERVEGHVGFKRLLPKLLSPDELTFDVLVATHPHCDHFDVDALPRLMNGGHTKLFASKNCRALAEKNSMTDTDIEYVAPGDSTEAGGFRLDFVTCDHGDGAPDAFGVMVSVGGIRIFETGDTCLRLDRLDEYRAFGKIDALIAPINGAFGNLDEIGCAKLSLALSPRYTIPCHFGMFAAHGGDPGRFIAAMKDICPQNEFKLMAMGEKITF